MAGALITILPKRVFDFGNVASGSSQKYTIAERIDISQYVDAVLIVRTHSAVASGGTIAFELYGDGFTPEDPGVKFVTSATLFQGVTIAGGVTGPLLQTSGNFTDGSSNVHGRYALFRITGTRTSTNSLTATVSADLLLRSPDSIMGTARR